MMSSLCREAGVDLLRGPHRWQMIRTRDLPQLIHYLIDNYRPMGYNRMSLMAWLTGMEKESALYLDDSGGGPGTTSFARRMEIEVHRIAGLSEPARTVAAVTLIQRVRDATTIAHVAREYLREAYKYDIEVRYPERQRWWKRLSELTVSTR